MLLKKIPLSETKAFSTFFLDYIQQKDTLKPFYNRFPTIDNFKDQIAEKRNSFSSHQRNVLVSTLQRQYQRVIPAEAVNKNLTRLKDPDTFTITTGHQLNIFTGPLYFIFKIVTVINACKTLKASYPQYNFVPVYWMASEDHDYDEIKYFKLYGKKYIWNTNQTGAVGRFTTEGLDKLLNELPGDISVFRDAYLNNKKLSDAVRSYVHQLFGHEGLITIDADDRDLKLLFSNVIEEDVVRGSTIRFVEPTNKALEDLHYKTQIFCRDCNFFYLDDGIRNRIEKQGNVYKVLDSSLSFTESEIRELIKTSPDKFSPNVILRPLYQEIILPNLAYVGGPAEMIYWLQLKNVFDHHNVPFPMLLPRNFGLVVEHHIHRKLEKTNLDIQLMFEEKNYIFNHWVLKNSNHNLTVGNERDTVKNVYAALQKRAEVIDKTLAPFVGAEGKRILDSLEKIEKKLLRAEKRIHADKLRQIEAVKDALFPGGSLQERTDNFLNFYQQDNQFIAKLIAHFNAFDFSFNVLTYTTDDQGSSQKNLS